MNNTNLKTKGDVLNQIIWNNQYIQVNKSSVFFSSWKKVSIENLPCLFDDESNTLMTFITFMQKYVKSNFLQYYKPSICNTTGMENYAKAGMSSTVDGKHSTCSRKAHMQNNVQYFTKSPALSSSNYREKTH